MAYSYLFNSAYTGRNFNLSTILGSPNPETGILKFNNVVVGDQNYIEAEIAVVSTTSVAGDYQGGSIYLSQIAGEGNASGGMLRGATTTGLWEMYGISGGDLGKALIVTNDTPGTEQFEWTTIPAQFTWNSVSGTTQTLAAGNGYIAKNVAQTTFTLPATASLGDTFRVVAYTAAGWRINPGTGTQSIRVGNLAITPGTGHVDSTAIGDGIELVCFDDTTPGSEVFGSFDAGNWNVI